MKFSNLDASTKKQIKSSMARISKKLLQLNYSRLDKVQWITAFNMWKNRYIATYKNELYYNLILITPELAADLLEIMNCIFAKELAKFISSQPSQETRTSSSYLNTPATEKQLSYASYLSNMIRNEALPKKNYSMYEINSIISSLKSQMKNEQSC